MDSRIELTPEELEERIHLLPMNGTTQLPPMTAEEREAKNANRPTETRPKEERMSTEAFAFYEAAEELSAFLIAVEGKAAKTSMSAVDVAAAVTFEDADIRVMGKRITEVFIQPSVHGDIVTCVAADGTGLYSGLIDDDIHHITDDLPNPPAPEEEVLAFLKMFEDLAAEHDMDILPKEVTPDAPPVREREGFTMPDMPEDMKSSRVQPDPIRINPQDLPDRENPVLAYP